VAERTTPGRPHRAKSHKTPRAQWRPKPHHRRAALLRAIGKTWDQVAADLGYRAETVRHYSTLPGWDDLVAKQVVGEGRRILDEAFIPVVREMISLALRRPERKSADDESVVAPKDAVKAAEWLADVWKRLGPLREKDPDDAPPDGAAPSGTLGTVTVAGSIRSRVAPAPTTAGAPSSAPSSAGPPPTARSRQRGDEDGDAEG
jgi:hypothetical protein